MRPVIFSLTSCGCGGRQLVLSSMLVASGPETVVSQCLIMVCAPLVIKQFSWKIRCPYVKCQHKQVPVWGLVQMNGTTLAFCSCCAEPGSNVLPSPVGGRWGTGGSSNHCARALSEEQQNLPADLVLKLSGMV